MRPRETRVWSEPRPFRTSVVHLLLETQLPHCKQLQGKDQKLKPSIHYLRGDKIRAVKPRARSMRRDLELVARDEHYEKMVKLHRP